MPTYGRLPMLDGWRAISIVSVLCGHLLPIGPKQWGLNAPIAAAGMAIFFTLSGFLIVTLLLRDQNILSFALKRVARIVPLAWVTLAVVLSACGAPLGFWIANCFFFANLPPFWLDYGAHFWSLGVEVQFYLAIAIVVGVFGRRGLWVVPVACLTVTFLRIVTGTQISIVTWFRLDEILAGGSLALLIHTAEGVSARRWIGKLPFLPIAILAALSADERLGWLDYPRPYLTAAAVGVTILRPVPFLSPMLVSGAARYLAGISYALYVFHPYTAWGWLGSGGRVARLAKRPLSLALSFVAAHLSTRCFEAPINARAHRWAKTMASRRGSFAQQAGPIAND